MQLKFKTLFFNIVLLIILNITIPVKASELLLVGEGTKDNPFEINGVYDFMTFSNAVNQGVSFANCYIVQNTNLDFNDIEVLPIGNVMEGFCFAGTYDGRGHFIENLNIETSGDAALFNCISGTICNLGIESGNIEGDFAAGFVSHTVGTSALIYNCYNKATVYGKYRAGGIVDSFSGSLINCVNLGECKSDVEGYAGAISYYIQNGAYIYSLNTSVFASNANAEYALLCKNIETNEEVSVDVFNKNVKNAILYGVTDKDNAIFWILKDGNIAFDIKDRSNIQSEKKYINKYSIYIPQEEGSEKNPIRIVSDEDLQLLSYFTNIGKSFKNVFFRQENDIDMSYVTNWKPIGNVSDNKIFSGKYDGNGKTISNLVINDVDYAGLFGRVVSGEICNVVLSNVTIQSDYAGGIACIGSDGSFIYNCMVSGTIEAEKVAGGIANEFTDGNIYNCWTCLNGKRVYGICGTSAKNIRSCYSNIELFDTKSNIENYVQFASEDNMGNLTNIYLNSKDFAKLLNMSIIKNKYLPAENCYLWKYDSENKNIIIDENGKNGFLKLINWFVCYKNIIIIAIVLLVIIMFWIIKEKKLRYKDIKRNQRNKTVDLLRMIFAINIMLLHWGQFMGGGRIICSLWIYRCYIFLYGKWFLFSRIRQK